MVLFPLLPVRAVTPVGGDPLSLRGVVVQDTRPPAEGAAGNDPAVGVVQHPGVYQHIPAAEDVPRRARFHLRVGHVAGVAVLVKVVAVAAVRQVCSVDMVFIAGEGDLIPVRAAGLTAECHLMVRLIADHSDRLRDQMAVGVAHRSGTEAQTAVGLHRGAVVADRAGLTPRLQPRVQGAADMHIAGADQQGAVAVVQGAGSCVQPLTGGNDRGAAVLRHVAERVRLQGQVVAVQPSGSGVANDGSRDMRQPAVNKSPVIQLPAQLQGGGVRADVPGGQVVECPRRERQVVAAPQATVIRQRAGQRQGQPVRRDIARVVKVLLQRQVQPLPRLQVAVPGQPAGAKGGVLSGAELPAGVDDRRGEGFIRVADGPRRQGEVTPGQHLSPGVVGPGRDGQGLVVIRAQGPLRVVQHRRGQREAVSLRPLVLPGGEAVNPLRGRR
ncbi:TPA: hypothetical protein ACWV6T_005756, partial [Salmonella enterica subsp. enterica serovar Muenchen]